MAKAEIIKRPVEQIGSEIKKSAWSAAIESLSIVVLGLLFIIWPDTMVKVLAYIVGAFFIIKGGFQIITYYMEKGQRDYFNNGLLFGVVSVLIGITALLIGENIASVFRVIIGVLVIYESLVRINTATKLAYAGVSNWRYLLLIALVMLVLGIFITFNTGAVVALIGGMMVATGVIGIIGDAMIIKQINYIVEKLTK